MTRAGERLNTFVIIIDQSENLELDKTSIKLRFETPEAEVAVGVVIKLLQ